MQQTDCSTIAYDNTEVQKHITIAGCQVHILLLTKYIFVGSFDETLLLVNEVSEVQFGS